MHWLGYLAMKADWRDVCANDWCILFDHIVQQSKDHYSRHVQAHRWLYKNKISHCCKTRFGFPGGKKDPDVNVINKCIQKVGDEIYGGQGLIWIH